MEDLYTERQSKILNVINVQISSYKDIVLKIRALKDLGGYNKKESPDVYFQNPSNIDFDVIKDNNLNILAMSHINDLKICDTEDKSFLIVLTNNNTLLKLKPKSEEYFNKYKYKLVKDIEIITKKLNILSNKCLDTNFLDKAPQDVIIKFFHQSQQLSEKLIILNEQLKRI